MCPPSDPAPVSRAEFENLQTAVRRLEDIRAIETLKYRYFRCIDTANLTELRELLHPELETDLRGGDYSVALNGADRFIDFIRAALHSRIVALHQGHHPEIDLLSETEARGRWYLWDDFRDLAAGTRMYGSAIYDDRYVKENGRWLIRETGYVRVFEAVEEVPNPPRLAAHMLGISGRRHAEGNIPTLEGKF